ncbi:hypothetical protein R1sor_010978 [Riccia sorocarpa]|uniref:Glycosyltransferase family 92 protein n=1 Tax=Riccia sorocarpa TaxID=122646 RepID=A0ABD3HZK6_9MARC
MGAVRAKRGQIFRLSFWNLTWASRGCRILAILCILGLIYVLGFTPFVPTLDGQRAILNLDEKDLIGNLVVEQQASNVLSEQDRSMVALPEQDTDGETFFLAAVIVNRVFKEDLFEITYYECKQWIEYMLYAGVEHIYWYDTAHGEGESQESHLREYVERGILTYHRFQHLFPGIAGYHVQQIHSYEHFLSNYGSKMKWAVEDDIDEYPFMPSKLNEFFLREYIVYIERSRPDVTQILMPCMMFGGNPEGELEDGWVIERYQRRKRSTEGSRPGFMSRTKPIFRPSMVTGMSIHDFPMKEGETMVTNPEDLRMNHYWGARFTEFKADTPALISLLVPDKSIQPIATKLKARTGGDGNCFSVNVR